MEVETKDPNRVSFERRSDGKVSLYCLGLRSWELETDLFSAFSVKCRFQITSGSEVEMVQLEERNQPGGPKGLSTLEGEDVRGILFIPVKQVSKVKTSSKTFSKSDEKVFKCDICNKEFPSKQLLKKHVRLHRRNKSCILEGNCDVVRMNFPSMTIRSKPLDSTNKDRSNGYHSSSSERNTSVSSEDRGSEDEKPHKNGTSKQEREDNTTETTICNICDESFTTANIKSHILAFHTEEEENNNCDVCGKEFRRPQNLKKHQLICKEEYACDTCDERFSTKVELKEHTKSLHVDKKKYSCERCDMVFTKPCLLNKHKLTHTKAKRFSCKKCHKGFTRKDSLNRHIFLLHDGNHK